MSWQSGCILIWDVTCPDTFALSHHQLAVKEAGAVAGQAERRKVGKYVELAVTHHFVQWWLRQQESLGQKHTLSFWSLADTSEKSQERPC